MIGGDATLEITRGSVGRKALEAGGTIRFERAGGLEEIAVEVRNRLLPILDDVHELLHEPQGDVRQTLKNLREFSSEARVTLKRLDALIEHADTSMTGDVAPTLRSLRETTARAENMSRQLEQSLPGLVRKADGTLEDLKRTSETIRGAVEQSAPQLPGLIGGTRDVVEGVSTSWPVKNMMPVPESGPVKMDSHD
jgi:phospholipid/cholesterol/gamma-HCH transport system substrate-binding protein